MELGGLQLQHYAHTMGMDGCAGLDVGLITQFLFPAPESSYRDSSFRGELLWVPLAPYLNRLDASSAGLTCTKEDEYSFPCLLLPCGSARFLILYFHRNAEDLGTCRKFCEQLRNLLYVHVFVVEFPGYGQCSSAPIGATQATKHAWAALAFVREALGWPLDSIIVFGCSVGTALATALAARSEFAGCVLAAPFLSVREAVKDRVGSMLAGLVTEQFPNVALAPKVKSPTLIVHGQIDTVVPVTHGEQMYEQLRCRKALVSPEDVGHNTCLLKSESFLLRPMVEFFGLPDYTFENIKVPAWAFQKEHISAGSISHVPTPRLSLPTFPAPLSELPQHVMGDANSLSRLRCNRPSTSPRPAEPKSDNVPPPPIRPDPWGSEPTEACDVELKTPAKNVLTGIDKDFIEVCVPQGSLVPEAALQVLTEACFEDELPEVPGGDSCFRLPPQSTQISGSLFEGSPAFCRQQASFEAGLLQSRGLCSKIRCCGDNEIHESVRVETVAIASHQPSFISYSCRPLA